MGTNQPINIMIMKTFTFRYAMSIDINASSEEESKKIFGTMDFNKLFADSEYVVGREVA